MSLYVHELRPSSQSFENYVALLWVEVGQPRCTVQQDGKVSHGPVVDLAVIRQCLAAKVRFRSQVSPSEICGAQSGTVTGFISSTSFPHVSIIPSILYTNLHLHVSPTRRTNGRSLGTF
jgi:hypothetical protein